MAAINKRKLLESAQKNLQKGAVDKALKDYEALLGADPRDANVRLKVGDLKLRLGKTDDAIAAYLKVADQFTRDGFDAKAVAIYKQVSKLDPKRYDVFIPLADLYQRLGLSSEAMVALQTAAEAYQRDGRKREALDLLRRMASLDATNTTSRLKVAELLLQEGLNDEAIVEFSEAAAELERQGDWEARATVLQRVVELAPDRIDPCEALATLWYEHNQSRRAEPIARKLVAIDPERAESLEILAQILSANGDEAGAIESFRKAADAWIARGMEDRARAILQRHIPSEPFDFGGTTDPLETGALAGANGGDSPFGEVGIGGEPLPLDDEFAFVDDENRLPKPPEAEPAPEPEVQPLPKRPEPKPKPAPVAAKPAPQPAAVAAPQPAPAPIAKAPPSGAATVVREAPTPAPVAATPAPAPVAAEAVEPEAPADPDQLLAEAGVYLRYGKRERAAASLEELLAVAPAHVGALELLGEVHASGDDTGRAVEVWTRAVYASLALGDAARVATLRTRIEAIDAAAAAALPAPAAPPRANPPATVLVEAPAPGEEAASADDAPDDLPEGAEGDTPLDDIEIDIDAAAFTDEETPVAADAGEDALEESIELESPPSDEIANDAPIHADSDEMEIEIDSTSFTAAADEAAPEVDESVDDAAATPFESTRLEDAEPPGTTLPGSDDEVRDDFAFDTAADASSAAAALEAPEPVVAEEPESEPEPEAEPDAASEAASDVALELEVEEPPDAIEAPAPPQIAHDPAGGAVDAAAPAAADGLSSTTSAAIHEELEEAGFYFEQGLLDEAESIYHRIVQRAPNHPAALLRLGEIAVARGQDSGSSVSEVVPQPAFVDSPEAEPVESGSEIEPPDDLDLTAREFGPQNAWSDDEERDDADAVSGDGITASDEPASVTDEASEAVSAEAEAAISEAATPEAVEETAAPEAAETPVVDEASETPEPEPVAEHELTAPEMATEESGAPAFDLAAELSEALDDAAQPTRAGAATDEDGFASLFSDFKRGVSRTLGEGDVETHFDLGIAYREMGLFDDAIGEFHYALGSGARRLDALHMMGLCALDLGRALDAIGHLEQALASPDFPDDREAPLRFDLGRAQEAQGDRDRALDAYRRVAELDAGFQDVEARIEALLQGPVPETAEDADGKTGDEAYESFDDLIAEAADEAGPRPTEPEAESYESFTEFLDEDAEDAVEPEETDTDGDAEEVAAEAAGDADLGDAVAAAETAVAEPEEAAPDADSSAAALPEAAAEGEPEPEPEPAPEAPAEAPRRRKISFF